MKHRGALTFSVISASLLCIFLFSCSDEQQKNNSNSAKTTVETKANEPAKSTKNDWPTYLVAVEASYAPFAFRDEKGNVVGYDEDILQAIGKAEHFNIKVLHQSWDGIFDTLNDGSRDIVASGVQLTTERQEKYGVSHPIDISKDIALVKDDSTIYKPKDLTGKKVAIQGDTTLKDMLKDYPGIDFIEYPSSYLAYKAMLTGKADAVFDDGTVLKYYRKQSSQEHKLRIIQFNDLPDSVGVFCVKKGNDKLINLLNEGLEKIKENGEYEKIRQKWFGNESQ